MSYPNPRPAVQDEDDIELPTHNFVTAHDIAKWCPHLLCNDQCAYKKIVIIGDCCRTMYEV